MSDQVVFIKELHGHSGCNLRLYKSGDNFFLRKDAGSGSYNERLRQQCIKQKCFRLNSVKAPMVLGSGIDDQGLFFFDMEYIDGFALSEYMNNIKIKEIVELVDVLFRSLQINNSKINANANNIFQSKIDSLYKTCDTNNPMIKKALDLLKQFDFSCVPESACCGDLTLENIIIAPRGLYVIDLLDSFYNSWMIDVAKLLQDIDIGWSYRHQKRYFGLNLRLATAKQALLDRLEMLDNGKEYTNIIYHILLLNILRIYPYTHDQETFDFLDNALKSILEKIESKEF